MSLCCIAEVYPQEQVTTSTQESVIARHTKRKERTMDKVYTEQEMRDKATELQESADEISRDAVEEGGCTYKLLCKADAREIETIANMLRQAAEMC